MTRFGAIAALAGLAILAGCGDNSQERGGVTAEEARELDNAAAMLDASPDSLAANEDIALGNGDAAVVDVNASADAEHDAATPTTGDQIVNNGALPPAQ